LQEIYQARGKLLHLLEYGFEVEIGHIFWREVVERYFEG
jgi:hypothetical protein